MKDGCGYEQLTQTFPCCDEKCEKCPFTIAEIDRQYGEAIKDALSDLKEDFKAKNMKSRYQSEKFYKE